MKKPLRVLVCGGRTYCVMPPRWSDARVRPQQIEVCKQQRQLLGGTLDNLKAEHGISLIITGGAAGADDRAVWWAIRNDVPDRVFRADWPTHGNAAGPIRNQQMIDEGRPDMVVAFPGGRGTADMVERAHRAGIKIFLPAGYVP